MIRLYRLAQKWHKVPAVLERSELRISEDADGKSFIPEFTYSYTVNGTQYKSEVHTHGSSLSGDREQEARKLVKSFPVGTVISVSVDPKDPASAVLDTGSPDLLIAVHRLCLVFVAVGTLILLYAAAQIDA